VPTQDDRNSLDYTHNCRPIRSYEKVLLNTDHCNESIFQLRTYVT